MWPSWLGRGTHNAQVAGSSPAIPTSGAEDEHLPRAKRAAARTAAPEAEAAAKPAEEPSAASEASAARGTRRAPDPRAPLLLPAPPEPSLLRRLRLRLGLRLGRLVDRRSRGDDLPLRPVVDDA